MHYPAVLFSGPLNLPSELNPFLARTCARARQLVLVTVLSELSGYLLFILHAWTHACYVHIWKVPISHARASQIISIPLRKR